VTEEGPGPEAEDGLVARTIATFACLAAFPMLSGCLVMDVAGATVGAAGAVVGGGVDLVTTSKEEQMKKDNERLRKENEELRRQGGN
jgi:hypothetical protein